MSKELSLLHQVGQRLAIGLPGTTVDDSYRRLVQEYKIANVVLFAHNIESKEQLHTLCQDIQALVKEETGYPAFITIDQEGGTVTRLSEDCTNMPGAMAIAATGNVENAIQAAVITGKELKALGVNFNLAPVLDINSDPDNPVIGVRSYGDTPEKVVKYAIPTFKALLEQDILAVGKHFPGHGDTAVDSHLALPKVEKTKEELWQVELRSFMDAIEADIPAIMTTHILFPAFDEKYPSTLSRAILTDLLRGEMGFEGLVLTDCMEMQAIQKEFGTVEGVLLSAKAGADVLLVSKNHDFSQQAAERMYQALENGDMDKEEMKESVSRILRFKKEYDQKPAPSLDVVGSKEHMETAQDLTDQSITIVNLPKAGLPELGDDPLFLGTMAYRSTIASTPPDERYVFVRYMQEQLGGTAKITPPTPTKEEIEEIIQSIERGAPPSSLVFNTYNGHIQPGQLELAQALAKLNIPMVVVALRNPYDLADIPKHVTTIAAFENSDRAFLAVKKVLTGKRKATGVLPVALG